MGGKGRCAPMAVILVNDPIHPSGVEALRDAGHEVLEGPLEGTDLEAALARIEGLVVRSATKADAKFLERAPQLKVIGRAGVGVDNIDLEACKKRGITVVNSPTASSNAVAELTFAHLLSVARNLPLALSTMKEGDWAKKQCTGFELEGKVLGLVGVGRIGARVAELAQAFGMTVHAFDPYVSEERATAMGVTLHGDVFELAAASNVVSVHTPLTPETKGLVGAGFFDAAPEGLVVVNCARGGVVDEGALLGALESGKVAGAGLDVFETEPPGATALVKHPRVSVTPHIGAATDEAQTKAGTMVAADVGRVLAGEEPESRVV